MEHHGVNWRSLKNTSSVGSGVNITEGSDGDLLVSLLADSGICRFLTTLETALAALLRVIALLLWALGFLTLGLVALFGPILPNLLDLFLVLDLQGLRGLGAGLVGAEVTLLFLLLGLFNILGFVLSRVAVFIVTIEETSSGSPCSQIVLIVVDGLDLETVGLVGLEGREAAVCSDLEGTGFTLR